MCSNVVIQITPASKMFAAIAATPGCSWYIWTNIGIFKLKPGCSITKMSMTLYIYILGVFTKKPYSKPLERNVNKLIEKSRECHNHKP